MIKNKKAYHNFFIYKIFEAGLVLKGWEVKSLRKKKVNISNGYLCFKNNELYIINLNIEPINRNNNTIEYKNIRNIKILLKKNEINFLYGKYKTQGYALIAICLYWKLSFCKLQIAIAKGKNTYDKRMHKKKQEWEIQKKQILKKNIK
ncbi:SsrA-binding protein SmpB [Buchnera aphidicola]|uniref:SsrA-binding protein SmpB n=1 Tax=Buchnera aphidicola TaxID=9 RepID=UPI0034645B97